MVYVKLWSISVHKSPDLHLKTVKNGVNLGLELNDELIDLGCFFLTLIIKIYDVDIYQNRIIKLILNNVIWATGIKKREKNTITCLLLKLSWFVRKCLQVLIVQRKNTKHSVMDAHVNNLANQ